MNEESLLPENEKAIDRGFIKGNVIHIVFRNEENFYTVALIRVQQTNEEIKEKKLTVVGVLPKLEQEETFLFFGHIIDHPKFGIQYQVEQFRRDLPQTKNGIIQYLSSDRFPGIGTKTAETIVETLGERAITKIVENRSVLDEIPKLAKDKADALYEQLIDQQGVEQVLMTLSKHGFGIELSMKVYQAYGLQALDIIQTNPYQLIADVEGIGFRRADLLGAAIGITGNHPDRIRAGCLFLLQELCLSDGHVYLEKNALIPHVISLLSSYELKIEVEEVETQISLMHEEDVLYIEDERVYMKTLYFAEKGIVTSVRKLLSEEVEDQFPEAEFLKSLGKLEEELKMEYAPSQKEAIQTALSSQLMILTGGPGTGKTTVIKGIVELYARLHGLPLDEKAYSKTNPFPILLVAPTGRAAKRMSEATELPATTIHRLLGWKGGNGGFDKGDHEPLEGELLIVDESSMVDIWLMNQLLKSVPKGMQVVLVGDQDQLPSVGPGQVLRDFLDSKVIPTVHLVDIYRQAEGSTIIELAHAMKQGTMPGNLPEPQKDRRFFPCQLDQVQQVVAQICENAAKKGYTAKDIQVLAPMYKGSAGITELNTMLQNLFNPKTEQRRELSFGDVVYRTGDVVLQLVNNPEENVYNGDRGEIVAIFYAKENQEKQDQLVISFDGIEVVYLKKDLNQITHAYCCSIHKAQGSEFPIVVMPVVKNYARMLRRNLLYTGITRAKQFLLLCGDLKAMHTAITQKEELVRNSMLQFKLQNLKVEKADQHNT
ncbi:SF1B family DNA helicase RecD2 [Halalkalibacter akibai]|uniref:ATP-dependent RecD2 DNA helicase n=1 Tax=Halalkalibacter akibai (strain ATCC 43226 / DSM 21942 / CIP 109018 / JCM 9157 / 1139) TaxID=1236973 RepID=W4QSK6_HALA3|nr:ATP-dependent RecD-like DNA helicase [Halalkalibacter akibai]GAE35071.1 RecD-like DNA helicase YrrC [Halalkalibacter akibai JCM 9157]